MHRSYLYAIGALSLLLTLACSEAGTSTLSGTPGWTANLTLAETPLVVFGADQERAGYDLSRPSGVVLFSDGRVAVMANDQRLLSFSADGALASVHGGRGQGPGQFTMPKMAPYESDTLLVYDKGNHRATWLHPESGLERSTILTTDIIDRYSPLGMTQDGAVVLSSAGSFLDSRGKEMGDTSRTAATILVTSNPRVVFSIPDILVAQRQGPNNSPGQLVSDQVRYAGTASIRLRGDTIFAIPGGGSDLELYGSSGELITSIPLDLPRAKVSAIDRAALVEIQTTPFREGNLNGHAPPPNIDATIEFLETTIVADSFAPTKGLILETSGDEILVVLGGPFDEAGWRAVRLTTSGDIVDRIQTRISGSSPVAFMGDKVLVQVVDDDGVTTFEIRTLVPVERSGTE